MTQEGRAAGGLTLPVTGGGKGSGASQDHTPALGAMLGGFLHSTVESVYEVS